MVNPVNPARDPRDPGSSRRIVLAGAATVTAVVLLFGYQTSTGSTAAGSTAAVSAAVAGASVAGGSSAGSSGGSSASDGASGTFTGTAADTRYGPVQVQVTVAGGEITAVDVVEYPTENPEDAQINARAVPVLVQETLSAQSADVDMVSGATYTSEGYLTSLQSALDQAGW